jgi:uncharacterized protein
MSISTLLLLILIGLSAGLLSGVVGVGGGIVMIPLLMLLMGMDQHQAQGTSLAVMLPPIGILAAWNYHKAGFVEWKYAMIIAFTFIIGGYLGSRWAVTVDARMLKRIFGLIMLLGGLKLIFK